MPSCPRRRRGTTLVEQTVVLAVVGVLAALALAGGARVLDAAAVHAAARDVADLLALARDAAVAQGQRVAVRIEGAGGRLLVHSGADTSVRLLVTGRTGVRVASSRDSTAYAPSGLGYGAANLQIVLTRGASAETVTVSRLGRVRRVSAP